MTEAYSSAKVWFFNGAGGATATVLTAQRIEPSLTLGGSILWGFIGVVVFISIGVYRRYRKNIYLLKRTLQLDNVYGEAIIKLNDAFAIVHNSRRRGPSDTGTIVSNLTHLCGKLKEIFDEKTGSNCSICIKVVTDDAKVGLETELLTLCRDAKSNGIKRRTIIDRELDVKHNIFKNSSFINFFDYLGKHKGRYYLNDNLPADLSYKNTSFEVHGYPDDSGDLARRNKTWPLPYKSEIVVPICPYDFNENNHQLYGFLCVDSNMIEVFNGTYDVAILQGVSDGIHGLIDQFLKSNFVEPHSEA